MNRWLGVVETLVVFACAWLLFFYYQFTTPWISGYDGYYHIKYAQLLREHGIIEEFPWAQFSLWRDHFADKEFLFHVLLIPFTFFSDLATGVKHAAVVFAAIIIVSFNLVLRLERVPLRHLWIVLLLLAGDVLLFRLHLPRPHLLSMSFMLWLVYATIRQRYQLLAVLSFFYAHAYTALHMPLVLGIIFCTGQVLQREKISWRALVVPTLAVFVAVLTSPYFPHNIIVFYVQNFELAWQQLFWDINLYQGTELKPMSTRYFLTYNLPLLLPFGGALYLSLLYPRKISSTTKHLLAMASAFIVMTMIAKRFVEYSYPIGLLFCACYCRDRWGNINLRSLWAQAKLKSALSIVLIALIAGASGAASYRNLHRDLSRTRPSRYEQGAIFLQQHTPANTTVFTCDWDDTPELFYFNHHNRYMIFMDPLFMYSWSPQVWHVWEKIAHGRTAERTARIIFHDFEIQYGLCTKNFYGLRNVVDNDPHMHIVYEDKDIYIFKITDPPVEGERGEGL